MKESKNDNLLVTLTDIKELNSLKEEQISRTAESIAENINLNGLKRAICNSCFTLSSIKADSKTVTMDNQERLLLINKLIYSQNNISANVRSFWKNRKSKKTKEELLNFIQDTIETLKTVKKYQPVKKEENKEQKQVSASATKKSKK